MISIASLVAGYCLLQGIRKWYSVPGHMRLHTRESLIGFVSLTLAILIATVSARLMGQSYYVIINLIVMVIAAVVLAFTEDRWRWVHKSPGNPV